MKSFHISLLHNGKTKTEPNAHVERGLSSPSLNALLAFIAGFVWSINLDLLFQRHINFRIQEVKNICPTDLHPSSFPTSITTNHKPAKNELKDLLCNYYLLLIPSNRCNDNFLIFVFSEIHSQIGNEDIIL